MIQRRFKKHLLDIKRMRTSVGRDPQEGLRLDRNERVTDFSPQVMRELYKILPAHLLSSYPDTERFYRTLSSWLKVPTEQLYVTNAITEGIRIVFETMLSPGDEIVMIQPTYPMYGIYGQIYQAKVKHVPFKKDLTLDIRDLCNAITNDTILVCFPNPNLPIESIFSLKDVRVIAEKCSECDTLLVIDEAYAFFGAESALPLLDSYDNVVIFQTFSKAFGLAGARLGYMISTRENIEYFSKTRSLVEANALSMVVGEYMLRNPAIMREYVGQVKEGKDYIQQELCSLDVRWHGGNYSNGILIFLKNKEETQTLVDVMKQNKIYIRGTFEPPIENCVRLTIGPKPAMERFMREFKEWHSQ